MSQNAKNNSAPSPSGAVFTPQVRIAWWYGAMRLLPFIALLYYYVGVGLALPFTALLALGWAYWLWANNHRIYLYRDTFSAYPPFALPFKTATTPVLQLPIAQLERVHIRLGQGLDQRQWLDLYVQGGVHHRLRCDHLHEQDPPEIDDHHHSHDQPEHELFALLDDEDFYEGSLQHLAALFYQQGVSVAFSND